jgi:allophanate hydrolase
MMTVSNWDPLLGRLDIATLRSLYGTRQLSPPEVIAGVYRRIAERGDDAVWIHVAPQARTLRLARALERRNPAKLPLYGIPFAVKDNIDVAGMPTTAACPDFSYDPKSSAVAVARLEKAGAICIGKTNLDQFATGLSGTRSPYGSPRCVFNDKYISGGSSSGSGVAVAAGLVSFALGTDTGGSGRVPAGTNNIVGLKPTRGIVPTTGLVPNCRTLDCVSVFALTCEDAFAVLTLMRGPADDPFDREGDLQDIEPQVGKRVRYGVVRDNQREFFGDRHADDRYTEGIERLGASGGTVVEIDFAVFAEAGRLMFDGPWVAERLHAVGDYVRSHPDSVLPITRDIILGAARYSALDAFAAEYRLRALKQQTRSVFAEIDVLVVPTTATIPTVAELEADPIGRNTVMGTYSYFVNLLDLAACAVPNGFRVDGLPDGLTFIAPPLTDRFLARIGSTFHQCVGGLLGKTGHSLPTSLRQSVLLAASGGTHL